MVHIRTIIITFITLSSFYCHAELTIASKRILARIPAEPEQVFYQLQTLLTNEEIALSQKSQYQVVLSEVAYFIDQPDYILKYASDALASGVLEPNWQVKALVSKARGHYQKQELENFFALANMAVIKAEKFDLLEAKISALVERAYARAMLNEFDKSISDANKARKYLDILPDYFEKAIILERLTGAYRQHGNFINALESQKHAIQIYTKLNSDHFTSVSYYNLARIYQTSKQYTLAIENMLKSYRWALKDKNKLNQAFSLSRLSEYEFILGNKKAAIEYLYQAVAAADASNSERVNIYVRSKMANFLCGNKDKIEECQKLLQSTIEYSEKFKMQADIKNLKKLLAHSYFQQRKYKEAYLTLKSIVD